MQQTGAQGPPSDPMRQEVRATLAARRELGPEYDDYFVETLVQRLAHHLIPRRKGARVAAEPVVRTARDPMVASANQRLFLAVLSLTALIFLALALAASDWGLAGFLLGSGAIGLINLLFAKGKR